MIIAHKQVDDYPQNYFNLIMDQLLCPISHELMVEPVTIQSGHTFDKVCIEAWFKRGHRTNPLTNLPLRSLVLYPNYKIKNIISKLPHIKQKLRTQRQNLTQLLVCIQRMWAKDSTPKPNQDIKIKNQYKKLEVQNLQLQHLLQREKKLYNQLNKQLQKYIQQNSNLSRENKIVRDMLLQFKHKINILTQKNQQYQNKIQILKQQIQQLNSVIKNLNQNKRQQKQTKEPAKIIQQQQIQSTQPYHQQQQKQPKLIIKKPSQRPPQKVRIHNTNITKPTKPSTDPTTHKTHYTAVNKKSQQTANGGQKCALNRTISVIRIKNPKNGGNYGNSHKERSFRRNDCQNVVGFGLYNQQDSHQVQLGYLCDGVQLENYVQSHNPQDRKKEIIMNKNYSLRKIGFRSQRR